MTLAEWATQLKQRGAMYIHSPTYATIVAFLSGYDQAILEQRGSSELGAFREWLVKRIGHDCTMHWSAIVRDQFSDRDEAKAVSILFDLIQEFSRSRPSESTRSTASPPQLKRRARSKKP